MAALRTAFASIVLLLAGGATLAIATDGFHAFTSESARRLAVQRAPVLVPDVTLQDQTGATFDLADLRGRWLLVDFIYTRCTTLCLTLGGDFAELQRLLGGPIAAGGVTLLSISFDPRHDTPARLAHYMHGHRGDHWRTARPLDDGLARIERSFGLTVLPDGAGGYVHNAAIHLIDPRGRLVAIFDAGSPAAVAREVQRRLGG